MLSSHQNFNHLRQLWHWLKGTWVDRLILLCLLIGIFSAWQWLQQHLQTGTPMVHIYHAKTLLATYPLNTPKAIHFQAQGDIGTSEITINQQQVWINHSSCRSKHCVRSGHRHQIGEMLACVPNRILVTIEGEQRQSFDAITE